MTSATTPNNNILPGLDAYDDTNHQVVKIRAKNISTDSSVTPNVVVGDLGVDVEVTVAMTAGASVALSSPPAQTNAGSDTTLTFSSKVNHFLVQNNTGAVLYMDFDTAASTSSIQLATGLMWKDDIPVTAIHVYTAAAQNVNGASGVVVKGWL